MTFGQWLSIYLMLTLIFGMTIYNTLSLYRVRKKLNVDR